MSGSFYNRPVSFQDQEKMPTVQGREKSVSSDTLPIPGHISCMVEQEKKFKFLWGYPNPEV